MLGFLFNETKQFSCEQQFEVAHIELMLIHFFLGIMAMPTLDQSALFAEPEVTIYLVSS